MLIVFLAIGLCALQHRSVEAGLSVLFEDLKILEVDTKYIDAANTTAFIAEDEDSDENTITTTLTLIKQLPADSEGRFLLTGLSMGKYTVPTGIDLKMPICEMLDEPIIMGPFFSVLGFTKESCPPEPGVYAKEGYKLPTESLPEEFPENKYLVYVEIARKDKPIIAVNIYADVRSD